MPFEASHKPHQIKVSPPIMVAAWLLISRTKSPFCISRAGRLVGARAMLPT